jgi:response regulator of citrate/malate metabolism
MMKILVVEDDPMVQRIITEFIKRIEGFVIGDTATDYGKAKSLIESRVYDLVLLDIYLPGGMGIELLKLARQQDRLLDFILITADNRTETLEKAMRYGAIDFLIKPFRYERFEEALSRYKHNKRQLHRQTQVNQQLIDEVMVMRKLPVFEEHTNHTISAILDCLKTQGQDGLTATEVANYVGVSRITARRYLEGLEQAGAITLELYYGGIGRPQNKYRHPNGEGER